jgi:membrane protease YdiL (CAAX protease family)
MSAADRGIPQYSLREIILVWLAAAVPMGIAGWFAAPFISAKINSAGTGRTLAISAGLLWQFVLVLILLARERRGAKDEPRALRGVLAALWLQRPALPGTGVKDRRAWLILIPLILITGFYQIVIAKHIIRFWTAVFPFFAEPPLFSLSGYLASPQGRAEMAGNWGVFFLYVLCALFNTFLGEELLFRGLLLPRMNGVCGKADWLINGVLFGLYHVHQPWGILSTTILGVFIFSLCAKIFKCEWFGILLHSGQSVFFIVVMLGMILG